MSTLLINCSNLKQGGGLQVADSLCCSLQEFPQHQFVVVLSSFLDRTVERINGFSNVRVVRYDVKNSIATLVLGRDAFLDALVEKERVDCVLTVFGPSRWNPRCPHVSGFARLQLVCPESPYYERMSLVEKLKSDVSNTFVKHLFMRSTKTFFSENSWVSKRVEMTFKGAKCFTITNYYNQVFDTPDKWIPCPLPKFDGLTILNVGSNYPHKNLGITINVARVLKQKYKDLRFRFLFTLSQDQFTVPEDLKNLFVLIGQVDISQCPHLYQHADIMFQPSLLECFTATYPEAMRMDVPIVTTDLEFAHSLCGDAALYYSPLDAEDAARKIMLVSEHDDVRRRLVTFGHQQLKKYDNYNDRSKKMINLCRGVAESRIREPYA